MFSNSALTRLFLSLASIYLEPWHADIFDFIDLRKNHGKEENRARDLFYALWIPDLFMKRVEANGDWPLMCPNECPGLADVYGDEFEALFESYEKAGKFKRIVPAQKLWYAIMESQTETGTPFICYKDAANAKSNQKNLGTIKSSNLCTEIIEYSAPDEVAVCNLASIALPTYIQDGVYNFQKLHDVVKVVTGNLNRIIDVNYYPVPEARKSNMRHRPIGLGVQGLADAFMILRMPFDGPEAKQLNIQIFETIYHAALEASCEIAERDGPYETYEGSPASQGIFQFDMWGVSPSELWDWSSLKAKVAQHGIRNSLLLAPMPTASTSQILGFNECFEPYTSYVRPLPSTLDAGRADLFAPLPQEHLLPPRPRRRVPGRLPVAAQGARRARPLGRRHEEPDHRPRRLGPEHRLDPGRRQSHLQDGLGDLAEEGHRPRRRPGRLH